MVLYHLLEITPIYLNSMGAYIKKSDRDKPWAKRLEVKKREIKNINIKSIFRIYCEGQNTEPEYFKSFPINTENKVEEVIGLGRSKTSLVEKVLELLSIGQFLRGQNDYDENRQLWVVFDFDKKGEHNENEDYENAIRLANENDINVAYSNDAFELWFVLHYKFLDATLTRKEYYEFLSSEFGINYEKHGKEKEFAKSIYLVLREGQQRALQNAIRLHSDCSDRNFCDQNPCTTVYKLVEELNKCIKT